MAWRVACTFPVLCRTASSSRTGRHLGHFDVLFRTFSFFCEENTWKDSIITIEIGSPNNHFMTLINIIEILTLAFVYFIGFYRCPEVNTHH